MGPGMRYGLREIGTGYHGKEPGEYVVDVVRALLGLAGLTGDGEVGWASCLTSRPFTGRLFLPARLGSAVAGRGETTGADRARLDLGDALTVLGELGWRAEPAALPGRSVGFGLGGDQVVVAGPLRAEDRWCPVADRLSHGEAWRHVLVAHRSGREVLCLDPLAGGLTAIPVESFEAGGVHVFRVHAPPVPPDPAVLAERCHRAGIAARARQAGAPDRDTAGYVACAGVAQRLCAGGAARRFRLSAQSQALHAMRWACLLGELDEPGTDELALADLLRDVVLGCRAAHAAVAAGDPGRLRKCLLALAATSGAVDELCVRLSQPRPEEGEPR